MPPAAPRRVATRHAGKIAFLATCLLFLGPSGILLAGQFQAGAFAIDVSPRVLPAIRNGGFLEQTNDRVDDPLHARCLVLSDGKRTLAIVIVDSCMAPRDVCDEIKRRIAQKTGIPANRVLIAATHTHSAPSLMDFCLGSRKDPHYAESFIPQVAEGIARAHGCSRRPNSAGPLPTRPTTRIAAAGSIGPMPLTWIRSAKKPCGP